MQHATPIDIRHHTFSATVKQFLANVHSITVRDLRKKFSALYLPGLQCDKMKNLVSPKKYFVKSTISAQCGKTIKSLSPEKYFVKLTL